MSPAVKAQKSEKMTPKIAKQIFHHFGIKLDPNTVIYEGRLDKHKVKPVSYSTLLSFYNQKRKKNLRFFQLTQPWPVRL